MGEKEVNTIEITDEDGYSCRLERWYSDYECRWKVAATCYRPDGTKAFHADGVWAEFSEDGARDQLDLVRNLASRLDEIKAQFTGLGKGDGPWTRDS